MPVYLKGITHYHPDQVITNDILKDISGADPDWILEKTGIHERRSMWDYEGDFPGLEIVKRCLEKLKQDRGDLLKNVGMIISASTHDDIHYPNPGNFIAEAEGLDVPVLQLKTACTSAAYAIYLAQSLIATSEIKEILVLNGEAFTRYVDYGDKRSCVLFGDAATAFVVSGSDGEFEILDAEIGGKGMNIVQENRTSDTSHLTVNEMASGELSPGKTWINRRRRSDKKFQQDGRAVVGFVLSEMPSRVLAFLGRNGKSKDGADHVILHQSNLVMMKDLIGRLGVESTKHLYNVDRFGNTSSAGWVSVLSQNQNRIASEAMVLVTVFGAGMTWANLLLRKI